MEQISISLNGRVVTANVDERTLLIEFIREVGGLTGTHAGCYEARCGCCAVRLDDGVVKSCNVLALQADGGSVTTVEGLAEAAEAPAQWPPQPLQVVAPEDLTPLQAAFRDHGAVQCGFCTPGMLMVLTEFLERNPDPTEAEVREAIRGNLCRCTGYQKIVEAALDAAARLRAAAPVGA